MYKFVNEHAARTFADQQGQNGWDTLVTESKGYWWVECPGKIRADQSERWNRLSEEKKRGHWRIFHILNTFEWDFFDESYNSADSIEEVEVQGGHQWVYTWDNPSKAPKQAENGVVKFPVFTDKHYSENWYDMEVNPITDIEELNMELKADGNIEE